MQKRKEGEAPGGSAMREQLFKDYDRAVAYNSKINLYDTVRTNENFFIGKQWEGVQSNGLPTPVFNFLKRVVLFSVGSIATDNLKIQAVPLPDTSEFTVEEVEEVTSIVNKQLDSIVEANNVITLLREFARNAAVDGDGATHTYFDPDAETGQAAKGAIKTEVIENTRVFFGNPNDRRVQTQPYIIIASRAMVEETQERAKEFGSSEWENIKPDTNSQTINPNIESDDKVTVLLRYRKDRKTGRIFAFECTKDATIREEWDTGLTLYPITWMNWDYVQDRYHGHAMISGLIPNQIFVNKLFAMAMISLMTTAYPKIVYDKTRIKKWDNRVGAAIGVNGGDVNNVARIIDPAAVSPQISQFINLAVEYTQTFLGATPSALGDVKPENTSAILALQRASSVPLELTKRNLHQCLEDLGRVCLDFLRNFYGLRYVGETLDDGGKLTEFNFKRLGEVPMSLKLDVGASAYWSEIASMQTLDNLLLQGKMDFLDYLERVPEGYISKKQELIDSIRRRIGGKPPADDDA